ncbi:MAG: helix-turn-helix transcriptional regulator [Patescibacteria group bacterium]
MRYKKYTQFIFDDVRDPDRKDMYGDLGLMYEFFALIPELRRQKRMTQHDLAKKAEISQPLLAKIEAGRANPTIKQLVKIAEGFDCKLTFEEKKPLLYIPKRRRYNEHKKTPGAPLP